MNTMSGILDMAEGLGDNIGSVDSPYTDSFEAVCNMLLYNSEHEEPEYIKSPSSSYGCILFIDNMCFMSSDTLKDFYNYDADSYLYGDNIVVGCNAGLELGEHYKGYTVTDVMDRQGILETVVVGDIETYWVEHSELDRKCSIVLYPNNIGDFQTSGIRETLMHFIVYHSAVVYPVWRIVGIITTLIALIAFAMLYFSLRKDFILLARSHVLLIDACSIAAQQLIYTLLISVSLCFAISDTIGLSMKEFVTEFSSVSGFIFVGPVAVFVALIMTYYGKRRVY